MLPYCEISCQTGVNCQAPLLSIIQHYFKDSSVKILVENVATPAMSKFDQNNMNNIVEMAKNVRFDEDMDFELDIANDY